MKFQLEDFFSVKINKFFKIEKAKGEKVILSVQLAGGFYCFFRNPNQTQDRILQVWDFSLSLSLFFWPITWSFCQQSSCLLFSSSALYLLGLILQLGTNRDHTVMVHLLTKAVSCSLFFNYCSLLRRLLNQKRNGFNNRAIFYCVLLDPVSIRYQRKTVRKYGTCCYTGLVSLQKIKAWLMV